jgi:hypothetical protein
VEVLAMHVRAARTAAGQPGRHSARMGHETRVNKVAAPGPRRGGLGRGRTWPETENKRLGMVKFTGDKKKMR